MKKLLAVLILLTAISCAHQDQKINLTLNHLNENSIEEKNPTTIDLKVFDDRKNKEVIGSKEFNEDEKIYISSEENLAEFLQFKISKNLEKRGFLKGKEKLVEIRVKTFSYKAERHFFIGKSKADIALKVVVKNAKNGVTTTKDFALSVKRKHFIAPLESTDAKTINSILEEIVDDVLSDETLLQTLAK